MIVAQESLHARTFDRLFTQDRVPGPSTKKLTSLGAASRQPLRMAAAGQVRAFGTSASASASASRKSDASGRKSTKADAGAASSSTRTKAKGKVKASEDPLEEFYSLAKAERDSEVRTASYVCA